MTASDIVKAIMKEKGFSYAALGAKIGSTPSTLSDCLNRRVTSMRVDSLLEMLTAMDCEIIIKDKIGKKATYVLDGKKEAE